RGQRERRLHRPRLGRHAGRARLELGPGHRGCVGTDPVGVLWSGNPVLRHSRSLPTAPYAGEARSVVCGTGLAATRSRTGPAGGVFRFAVRVTTDAAALTPLSRTEMFNDDFRHFAETVRGDSAHPDRFRRLEREVRGMELLCSREKLMAGLPNFATYFGRDMLMTALLMEPVWAPAMPEHVIASALRKLSAAGDVSHEEALGGQAIREHASEYNRLVGTGDGAADG